MWLFLDHSTVAFCSMLLALHIFLCALLKYCLGFATHITALQLPEVFKFRSYIRFACVVVWV